MADILNESEAVRMLSTGDIAAFDHIYFKYHQQVYANICKITGDPKMAEDLLQEVFFALWKKRDSLHVDKSVANWLFVVSYNKSVSFLRKKIKESFLVPATEGELADVKEDNAGMQVEQEFASQAAILDLAVDRLPGRKKEVFKLCRYEGRTPEEVALMMGISVQSVKDYLKQSTQLIRNYVRDTANIQDATVLIGMLTVFMNHN
ncbi:RNA polymerase sigma factor [Filimonas effusa]|uniref:Sigma-70 family RNA polymerase sigma factor n=1 Tax=Filimonas effusa TaxID=2508721 RepID=A0A4Q1D8I4_9BACT|nr:sigma-70 family RNA polymerase sigma factor [Filimonas effusa]RXK85632.1 sigma-70 family RNA polymerase sigma factor [Filimonas effusa]